MEVINTCYTLIYVKKCTEKAIEVFNFTRFSHNLLVVYNDIYSNHGVREKEFVESILENIIQYDNYKLDWIYFQRMILPIHATGEFKEIILSDIGGAH